MSESKEFDKALEGLKNSFAGKDGVIHLFEQGYSFSEIQSSLDFPFSMDRIAKILWDHLVSNETILLRSPESGQGKENATYVRESGPFGKQSFIKVTDGDRKDQGLEYKKVILKTEHDIFSVTAGSTKGVVKKFIDENSNGGPDYVSLDFGRLKSRSGSEWVALVSTLTGPVREYVEYLPWEKNVGSVYHKIDGMLMDMLSGLEGTGHLPGVFYFSMKDD